jgi:hypothetical protein
MIGHRILFLLIMSVSFNGMLNAFFPINIFRPFDINLMPEPWPGKCLQLTGFYEAGFNFHGFAPDENEESITFTRKMNPLQMFQDTQNSLAMFKGLDPESDLAQFAQQFNADDDDGVRGHLLPRARLRVPTNLIFSARYYLPCNINVSIHVPFIAMELCDVHFKDLTLDVRAEDRRVKQLLTDDLVDNLKRLAHLDITSWRRSGLGDILIMGQWLQDFPQLKPVLRNVRLNARVGLTLPTGLRRDEDRLLALPFGNDGSVGIVFGGGLDLLFGSYLRAGGDLLLLHLFGNFRNRRIKTDVAQTDLLLLTKVPTFKDFGWTQQFNLYVQAWQFYRGLSLKLDYEYIKHHEDRLWIFTNEFDARIANSAENLQESTLHGLIINASYDFQHDLCDPLIGPYISLFGKVGFNGKRAILGNTVGISLSLSF